VKVDHVVDRVHAGVAVLVACIDRLPERAKRVLQTAAVVGKEFAEPVLAEVAELPGADLAAALAALEGAEVICEEALYPDAEYAFKHSLTQEVALES
jgi:predicted ATPase